MLTGLHLWIMGAIDRLVEVDYSIIPTLRTPTSARRLKKNLSLGPGAAGVLGTREWGRDVVMFDQLFSRHTVPLDPKDNSEIADYLLAGLCP